MKSNINLYFNSIIKKALLCIFLLYSCLYIITAENQEPQLIKRTVLILPFLNTNKVEKYNYLQDTLLNALNSELIRTDQFNFISPIKVQEILKKENEAIDYYEKIKKSIDMAIKLKADVVVIGQYIIIEDKIMIQIKAIDVFSKQIAASSNINGGLGVDIFRIIVESSKDIAYKMVKEFKMVDKTYFDEMSIIINKNNFMGLKKPLTPMKKAGIALISTGSSLLSIGIPFMIYDLISNGSVVADKKVLYEKDDISYNEYMDIYQLYIGLLVGSVAGSVIGLTTLIIGIPLIVYKDKVKLSFNINYKFNNDVDLYFKLFIN